jgi:hypothetical protein
MTNPPDRDLTPSELRQLIASNAKAIAANSDAIGDMREGISELRQSIAETRAIADSNARAIRALSSDMFEGFAAVQRDFVVVQGEIQALTRFLDNYAQGQARQNGYVSEDLQAHDERIARLEGDREESP